MPDQVTTNLGQRLQRKLGRILHSIAGTSVFFGLPSSWGHHCLGVARGRHQARVGILIGNGPSVRSDDLDALADRISFYCNRFYLAYDQFRFRPTYLVSSDRQMIDDFGAEMLTRAGCQVWFVDDRRPRLDGPFHWVRSEWSQPFRFFRDVSFRAGVGGATLVAATHRERWVNSSLAATACLTTQRCSTSW